MPVTQKDRVVALETPLGEDVLLITNFSGTEGLGRLYSYSIELQSEDHAVNFDDIIGQNVTIRLNTKENGVRYFNGYVSRFTQSDPEGEFAVYHATVVPWLWFLTQAADCRIFQEKTVPDIIEEVFKDHGFDLYELRLNGSYRIWEYCVQYRETDFNFVSRLMEQEGIYYFFIHEDGNHTLILADSQSAHEPCPGYDTIKYRPPTGGLDSDESILYWTMQKEFLTSSFAHTDFDFKAPKKKLMANSEIPRDHAEAKFEFYDYPGEYLETADGDSYAKIRIEEIQAQHETYQGQSDARGILLGHKFTLEEYYRDELNQEYTVINIQHTITSDSFTAGSSSGDSEVYQCSLTAIRSDVDYRGARETPKPSIPGPQTAIIVGDSGEEIHVDEFGRVKVQFHWDRDGTNDANSSCWIRVSQEWAGKKWGAMYIPRIGQEVIVEFLEGDPDRPIITGRVYNGQNMPPYELPAEKTKSTLKSNSSKGGTASANFNEIRFEDKKGSEELYIHAEKDQNNIVENDETTQVGHDRAEDVGNDETINIGNNRTETVGNDESITIGNNRSKSVGNNETITIGNNLTESVTVNYMENVGAAMELTIGGAMAMTIGAAMAQTVGGAKAEIVGAARSVNVGGNNSLNVGKNLSESISKDKEINIGKDLTEKITGQHKETVEKEYILNAKKIQMVAENEISIKTGKAEIVLKKNGDITIKGKKINVKGSGDVIVKGSKIKQN